MSKTPVKPIPDGYHSLTPLLVCANAAGAIEFYKKAFGAVEEARIPGASGKLLHGQVRIGDSPLMLTDEWPDMGALGPASLKGSPVTIHLFVTDVDAAMARAEAAGAKVKKPASDMFWGDRYGVLEDPFGHSWSLATHVQDLTPDEIKQNLAKMNG